MNQTRIDCLLLLFVLKEFENFVHFPILVLYQRYPNLFDKEQYLYKLMAYKDEYEVARLYSDGDFMKYIQSRYEGDYKVKFNLAPPLFAKKDPATGQMLKKEYGPSMLKMFGLLAKMKFLRGTSLDIFGYSAERKMERQLIKEYKDTLNQIMDRLNHENYDAAVELAAYPEHIRGYGHVKERYLKEAETLKADRQKLFDEPHKTIHAEQENEQAA